MGGPKLKPSDLTPETLAKIISMYTQDYKMLDAFYPVEKVINESGLRKDEVIFSIKKQATAAPKTMVTIRVLSDKCISEQWEGSLKNESGTITLNGILFIPGEETAAVPSETKTGSISTNLSSPSFHKNNPAVNGAERGRYQITTTDNKTSKFTFYAKGSPSPIATIEIAPEYRE